MKEEMTTNEVVDLLLNKGNEINNKIINTISELLRLGYDSERGKNEVKDLRKSIEYSLDEIERILNRWNKHLKGRWNVVTAADINKYVVEEMGYAEEQEDKIVIRLDLSNGESVEIWFDEYNDCYTWSNASYGYEDTYAVVQDIFEWLQDNSLEVINMETV